MNVNHDLHNILYININSLKTQILDNYDKLECFGWILTGLNSMLITLLVTLWEKGGQSFKCFYKIFSHIQIFFLSDMWNLYEVEERNRKLKVLSNTNPLVILI